MFISVWILLFSNVLNTSVLPWDSCTWPNPKPFYERLGSGELLSIQNLDRSATADLKSKVFSRNGIYYFVSTNEGIVVCGDKKNCFRVSVPEFSWRPISSHWVNEKLLYVDVTFNPHAGAFWLIDVEEGSSVHAEHWLESLDEWSECQKHQPEK